jgi:cell division protein ZipA
MDFGPREVLIALGALLVCGIILDGVRRMRAARRGSLRGPRRQSIFDDDAGTVAGNDNDELPGPVRVVAIRDEQTTAEINQNLRRNSDTTFARRTTAYLERAQGETRDTAAPAPLADHEPLIAQDADRFTTPVAEPDTMTADHPLPEPESTAEPVDKFHLDADDLPLFKGEPATEISLGEAKSARSARSGKRRGKAAAGADAVASGAGVPGTAAPEAVEVDAVVIHLMAPSGQTFSAKPLFAALQNAGLKFGERNIFHSYAEDVSGHGQPVPLFSVANALKPGAFEGSLHDFSTPGVAFFMLINELQEPLAVFDAMLIAAQAVARELDAELKDEQRAALTRSGIAHYRQRILDYSRRHGLSG